MDYLNAPISFKLKKTKEALEKDSKVIVQPYSRTRCFGISMPKLR